MEDQKTTEGQPQVGSDALLGVSRFALDRAMCALEYQVRSVKECPQLDSNDMMGVLMREGLKNSEKALEEVRAALFA